MEPWDQKGNREGRELMASYQDGVARGIGHGHQQDSVMSEACMDAGHKGLMSSEVLIRESQNGLKEESKAQHLPVITVPLSPNRKSC